MSNSSHPQVGLYREVQSTLEESARIKIDSLHCGKQIQKYVAERVQQIVAQIQLPDVYRDGYSFGLTAHSIRVYNKDGKHETEIDNFRFEAYCQQTLDEVNRLYLGCRGHTPLQITPQQPDHTALLQQALTERSDLVKTIEQRHDQQVALIEEKCALQLRLQELTSLYAANHQRLIELEPQKEEATIRIAELEAQFETTSNAYIVLAQEYINRYTDVQTAQQRLAENEKKLADLQAEHQRTTTKLNAEIEQMTALFITAQETTHRGYTDFMEKCHRDLMLEVVNEADQELKITTLSGVIHQATMRLKTLLVPQNEKATLTDLLTQLQTHLSDLATEKGDLSKEIQTLQMDLQKALLRINIVQEESIESSNLLEEKLRIITSQNLSLSDQLAAIENVLNSSDRSGSASTQLASFTSGSTTPSSSASKAETPHPSDDEALEEVSPPALVDKIRQTLEQHYNKVTALENQIALATQSAKEQQQHLLAAQERVTSQTEQLQQNKLKIEQLQGQIDTAKNEKQLAETSISQLEAEVNSLRDKLKTTANQLVASNHQLDELNAERGTIAGLLGNPDDQINLANRISDHVETLKKQNAALTEQNNKQQQLATRAISCLNGQDTDAAPSEIQEVAQRFLIASQEKEARIALLEAQLDSLKQAQQKTQGRENTLATSLEEKENLLKKLNELLPGSVDLRQAVEELKTDVEQARITNRAHEQKNQQTASTLQDISELLNLPKTTPLETLAKEIQKLINSKKDLSRELSTLKTTTETTQAESTRKIDEANDLIKKIANALKHTGKHSLIPDRVQDLNKELINANSRVDQLAKDLQQTVETKKELDDIIAAITKALPDTYRKALPQSAQNVSSLPPQIQQMIADFNASLEVGKQTEDTLQTQLNQLDQQLKQVTTQLKTSEGNSDALKTQQLTLQEEIAQLSNLQSTLKDQLTTSKTQIENLENQLANSKITIQEQNNKYQTLQSSNTETRKKLKEINEELADAKRQLEEHTQRSEKQAHTLSSEKNQLDAEIQGLRLEIHNLENEKRSLQKTLQESNTELGTIRATLDTANTKTQSQSQEISRLLNQISSLNTTLSSTQELNAIQQKQLEDAQGVINTTQQQLQALQKEASNQSSEHSKTEKQLNTTIANLEEKLRNVSTEASFKDSTIQSFQNSAEQKEKQIQQLTQAIKQLKLQQEELSTAHQKESANNAQTQESLRNDLQRYLAAYQELQATRRALRVTDVNVTTLSRAEQVIGQVSEQQNSIESLNQELERIKQALNDATQSKDLSAEKISTLQSEKTRLTDQVARLEANREQIIAQHEKKLKETRAENTKKLEEINSKLKQAELKNSQLELAVEQLSVRLKEQCQIFEELNNETVHHLAQAKQVNERLSTQLQHQQQTVEQLRRAQEELKNITNALQTDENHTKYTSQETHIRSLIDQLSSLQSVKKAYNELQRQIESLNEATNLLLGALAKNSNTDIATLDSINDPLLCATDTMKAAAAELERLSVQESATNDDDDDISVQRSTDDRSPSNQDEETTLWNNVQTIKEILNRTDLILPANSQRIIKVLYYTSCILQDETNKKAIIFPVRPQNTFLTTVRANALTRITEYRERIAEDYAQSNSLTTGNSEDQKLLKDSLKATLQSIRSQYLLKGGPRASTLKTTFKELNSTLTALQNPEFPITEKTVESLGSLIEHLIAGPVLTKLAVQLYQLHPPTKFEAALDQIITGSPLITSTKDDSVLRKREKLCKTLQALYELLPPPGSKAARSSSTTTSSPSLKSKKIT